MGKDGGRGPMPGDEGKAMCAEGKVWLPKSPQEPSLGLIKCPCLHLRSQSKVDAVTSWIGDKSSPHGEGPKTAFLSQGI